MNENYRIEAYYPSYNTLDQNYLASVWYASYGNIELKEIIK